MGQFPMLSSAQVALLRAEINTGPSLDEEFKTAINDQQKVYTVFTSVNEAENFAKEILLEKQNVEVNVYDAHEKVLNCLRIP